MSLRVNEIFESIQGEGFNAGKPAVFLRLQGCNLQCSWCDTEHSSGRKMSCAEVAEVIQRSSALNVVVTGGEPMMQLGGLTDLMRNFDAHDWYLETNGTFEIPYGLFDWVCVSPKAQTNYDIPRHNVDELKFVIDVGTDLNTVAAVVHGYPCQTFVSLQPVYNNLEIAQKIIHFMLSDAAYSDWKLSLQLHKILEVR